MPKKRYSPKLKFQVILGVLRGHKSMAQVAKACEIHPNSISAWRREFVENGPDLFDRDGLVSGYEGRMPRQLAESACWASPSRAGPLTGRRCISRY